MEAGGYRGARFVAETLARLARKEPKLDILDVGCGTGLVGVLLKEIAATLVGVDTSPEMLARAAAKGVYSALHREDLVQSRSPP